MPKGMHNPLPASLTSECKKATQILDSFINGSWRGSPGRELPERVLQNAKGLAILTVTKAGILGSLRIGSGIILARLPDSDAETDGDENNNNANTDANNPENTTTAPRPPRWSPPSAISLCGLGFGGQAGFELTDFVFILNTWDSLETFSKLGSLTLSGNFSIAFGPLGRNAEIAGGVSSSGGGKMMSFAKTKGLFGGVSVESGVVVERRWANRRFYGRGVRGEGILKMDGGSSGSGLENVSEEGREAVAGLMRVLGEVFGGSESSASGPVGVGEESDAQIPTQMQAQTYQEGGLEQQRQQHAPPSDLNPISRIGTGSGPAPEPELQPQTPSGSLRVQSREQQPQTPETAAAAKQAEPPAVHRSD
ncbi:hypothetical protein BJY04DRAFT_71561 [Aspergillus karnatakaensis]|uniref:uncharacterized protein n=1 Tax=Aspergillus karnatakaensis TaxID=1810916 RepID=UPI003CCDAE5A